MPTSRSYQDACGIARALDVVGERWALLVVRELLLGPQRFADLRTALPRASSNLVADRLRELAGHGVVVRRRLPPPAASWVYELTARGRQLEPVVLALGDWGVQFPHPGEGASLSASSVLLYLRSAARAGLPPATWRVQLGEQVWTVRSGAGAIRVEPGEPDGFDGGLATDPRTLNDLLGDPAGLDAAVAAGAVTVAGDPAAVRTLLGAVTATG